MGSPFPDTGPVQYRWEHAGRKTCPLWQAGFIHAPLTLLGSGERTPHAQAGRGTGLLTSLSLLPQDPSVSHNRSLPSLRDGSLTFQAAPSTGCVQTVLFWAWGGDVMYSSNMNQSKACRERKSQILLQTALKSSGPACSQHPPPQAPRPPFLAVGRAPWFSVVARSNSLTSTLDVLQTCRIGFAGILSRIFASAFIKDIGL